MIYPSTQSRWTLAFYVVAAILLLVVTVGKIGLYVRTGNVSGAGDALYMMGEFAGQLLGPMLFAGIGAGLQYLADIKRLLQEMAGRRDA